MVLYTTDFTAVRSYIMQEHHTAIFIISCVVLTCHLFPINIHRRIGAGMTKSTITPMPKRKNGRTLAVVHNWVPSYRKTCKENRNCNWTTHALSHVRALRNTLYIYSRHVLICQLQWHWTASAGVINTMQGVHNRRLWLSMETQH